MEEIPLLGFAPDLPPEAKGYFQDCSALEPTTKGWKIQRGTTSVSTLAASGVTSVRDGFVSSLTTGTEVVHLAGYGGGLDRALFRKSGAALVNCSRAAPYSSTTNFCFCQYGNYTLATNLTDVLQIRDASGTTAFANSAAVSIPKAKICFTWGPTDATRVMLLYYNDGSDKPNGWWSSHNGGPTADWTPDVATGAANDTIDGASAFTCGIGWREYAVAFTAKEMYLGEFVGPPTVITWRKVADDIGCVGMFAARVVNGILYFVSDGGLYSFDGTYPKKVEIPIQNWLKEALRGNIATVGTPTADQTQLAVDTQGQRLLICLRASPATVEALISINLLNGRAGLLTWGSATGIIDNRYRYYCSAGTITLLQEATTPDTTATPSATVSYIGDPVNVSLIRRIVPRFSPLYSNPPATAPTSFAVDYAGVMSPVDAFVYATHTSTATPWRIDLLNAARLHSIKVKPGITTTAEDPQLESILVDLVRAGLE